MHHVTVPSHEHVYAADLHDAFLPVDISQSINQSIISAVLTVCVCGGAIYNYSY